MCEPRALRMTPQAQLVLETIARRNELLGRRVRPGTYPTEPGRPAETERYTEPEREVVYAGSR